MVGIFNLKFLIYTGNQLFLENQETLFAPISSKVIEVNYLKSTKMSHVLSAI